MAARLATAAALSLVLLCAAPASSQARVMNSAADFLDANADEFQCMTALFARAGLTGALAADLNNTYFMPGDSAFLVDMGTTASAIALGTDNPYAKSITVPEILNKIDAMPKDNAVQFVKAHVVPAPYPTVTALAFPKGRPTTDPDPEATPVYPKIKNSLGQNMEVVFEWGANNVHLALDSDGERIESFVAGPAAIPVGQATVYIMHATLAPANLIMGDQ